MQVVEESQSTVNHLMVQTQELQDRDLQRSFQLGIFALM